MPCSAVRYRPDGARDEVQRSQRKPARARGAVAEARAGVVDFGAMSKKPARPAPVVGLVMGSDSDWPLVSKAHETLDALGVPHEVRVMSAHRTPTESSTPGVSPVAGTLGWR